MSIIYITQPDVMRLWPVKHVACPLTSKLLPVLILQPCRDGQAELTQVACYIPRWFAHPQMVAHPIEPDIAQV